MLENDIVPFDAIVHSLQSERLPDEHPVFNVGISQDAVVDMILEGEGGAPRAGRESRDDVVLGSAGEIGRAHV